MSVNIRHSISVIRQPMGSNLCWAAAIAMVQGSTRTARQVADAARAQGVPINADDSLSNQSPSGIRTLASAFGLQVADVRQTSVTAALLQRYMAPNRIAILGSFSYVGAAGAAALHAICGFSLVGGGGDANTRFGYADPYRRDTAEDILETLLDNFLTDPHYILHQ